MKVNELFEAEIPNPSKNFNKEFLAGELKKLFASPEYKEFLTNFDDVTGKVALGNGSLSFRYKDPKYKGYDEFNINREGQIRTIANSKMSKANSPEPAKDYLTRYKNCLAAITSLISKRKQSEAKVATFTNGGYEQESLTEIEFPNPCTRLALLGFRKITDLQGLPATIGGRIEISQCPELTSLVGLPKKTSKSIQIRLCPKLESLEGLPEKAINGDFGVENSRELTSLKGMPVTIKGDVRIRGAKLHNLEGLSSKIDNLYLNECGLTSLQGIHKIFKGGTVDISNSTNGFLYFYNNPIKSHVLGLLLIPDIRCVTFISSGEKHAKPELAMVEEILNKHIARDKDVVDCQQELIDAGLKAFAQL